MGQVLELTFKNLAMEASWLFSLCLTVSRVPTIFASEFTTYSDVFLSVLLDTLLALSATNFVLHAVDVSLFLEYCWKKLLISATPSLTPFFFTLPLIDMRSSIADCSLSCKVLFLFSKRNWAVLWNNVVRCTRIFG